MLIRSKVSSFGVSSGWFQFVINTLEHAVDQLLRVGDCRTALSVLNLNLHIDTVEVKVRDSLDEASFIKQDY